MDKGAKKNARPSIEAMVGYINGHLMEEITLEALGNACGYSPYHASKVFKKGMGVAPFEYIREKRLANAAAALHQTKNRILDIALAFGFSSHEGFTRSFSDRFGLSPFDMRRRIVNAPAFMPCSRKGDLITEFKEVRCKMDNQIIFTQVIERPKRKLLLIRGKKAKHYFEYCEELGCDVWGKLLAVKGALYEPIGMWLPENMRPEGTSYYAQGVEVPENWGEAIPDGMEMMELEECKYMVFQGQPYECDREDKNMYVAITQVQEAMKSFNPKIYGWEWDDGTAPRIQLAPMCERGYIEARPVHAVQ